MKLGQLLPDGFFFGARGRRDGDVHYSKKITPFRLADRQTHPGKTKLFPGLSAGRDLQLHPAAKCGYGNIGSQNRVPCWNFEIKVEVGPVDFKIRMALVFDAEIKVA